MLAVGVAVLLGVPRTLMEKVVAWAPALAMTSIKDEPAASVVIVLKTVAEQGAMLMVVFDRVSIFSYKSATFGIKEFYHV